MQEPNGRPLELIPLELDSPHTNDLIGVAARQAGEWLLPATRLLDRLFVLRSMLAPGLGFIGAQASIRPFDVVDAAPLRLSAGGTGVSLAEALTSCMGEALEFLSQVEREGDARQTGTVHDLGDLLDPEIAAWLKEYQPALASSSGRPVDWVTATSVDSRRATLVPADLCLRRSERRRSLPLRGPLSTGCAVGRTRDEAATRAILELIERDAVALWWLGGRLGRPVPANGPIATHAAALLARLRRGQTSRRAWLLDITTDLDVPTFAALSVDGNARKLACGFAARVAARDAVRGAILEMAQVEAAFALVDMKLAEGGPAALDDTDRRHAQRGALETGSCDLLHPAGLPAGWPELEPHSGTALSGLLQRLGDRGVGVWLTDQTRPDHGIDAIRAFAPSLQPYPSTYRTRRLLSTVDKCGGGNQYTEGVDIM